MLLERLDLTLAQREPIEAAKQEIRDCMREGLPRLLKQQGYTGPVMRPRFFTQGSAAYKTLNAPARPTQQADIDDGCYLPLSFVAQVTKPSVASAVFFAAAETALLPLVKLRGWHLDADKPTCVRIVISPFAHIDVPLYAIPDNEFQTLQEAAFAAHGHLTLDEAIRKSEQDAWTALPTDHVLLAHREEDWKKSDPRPVKTWFLGEVARHGEQFRRSIRYVKSFRDWQWLAGGPASILLMAASAPVFETRDRRDDLALLDLVEKLPDALRDGVCNPVDRNESLTERLGKAGVDDAAKKFEQLENYLRGAINASNAEQACSWLVDQFGKRFPNEPFRIKQTTVAATVLATPAAATASPLVGRTQAG